MKIIRFPEKLNNFVILAILLIYALSAAVVGVAVTKEKEILQAPAYEEHVDNEKVILIILR